MTEVKEAAAPQEPVTLKSALYTRMSMSNSEGGRALLSTDDEGAPSAEHILQFFKFAHLPPHLREVSEPFAHLAEAIASTLPRNPERTVALRKLMEAKDAAVRAVVAK